jgi:hypothetical protein
MYLGSDLRSVSAVVLDKEHGCPFLRITEIYTQGRNEV